MSDSATKPINPLFSSLSSPDDLLRTLLEVSLNGYLLYCPVYGPDEEPVDFAIEYLNPAGQRMLRLPERPGGTLLGHFPHTQATGIFDFYKRVFRTGTADRYDINYQHDGLDNYFHLAAGRSGELLVVSFTDTADHDRTAAEQVLRESQAREQTARAYADLQRQQLHSILMQAPAMICIFEGPNHVFKLVNPPYQQLVGDRPIIGKPIAEAMPELAGQPIFGLLDKVYRTGQSFYAHEMLVQLDHHNTGGELGHNYYNFIYQALRNLNGEIEGIVVFAYEVTAQVRARQQVEFTNQHIKALNEKLETRVTERTQALQQAQKEAEGQRQVLERLFMQAPAAICILTGPDLVFELVNPGYQQLFPGRPLLGKPVFEALPEVKDQPIAEILQNVFITGQTFVGRELSVNLARQENAPLEESYFNFIYQARLDEQNQVSGILVFAFEVTDLVKARQASEASAQQLRLITDALPVLIGYLDREEKYRFANQAYESWFNQKPENLLGRPVREVVGEKAYRGVFAYIQRALAGERLDFEVMMPYREGFVKHIHTSYVPDIRAGEVHGFFTMVTDVTAQVEARQAVEESERQAKALAEELAAANEGLRVVNQQLTRTNIDLDNFIYTASHDLKAPILNIEGLMNALIEQLSPESLKSSQTEYITKLIFESVQRFKRTIDHLTEITKLQKENSGEALPVNVAALIADVQLDLAPAIQAAGAEVQVDVTQCPTINFSQKNLRSIIYNLLSNAIKYRSPDRVPLVQVLSYEAGNYQVLSVQDNGLGMDLSEDQKLFAMFQRLHDHVEGSGIGLYMVKKIIENAGGKIEVQSKLGKGSVFHIYFRRNA